MHELAKGLCIPAHHTNISIYTELLTVRIIEKAFQQILERAWGDFYSFSYKITKDLAITFNKIM